jgi:TatD DNase family protein
VINVIDTHAHLDQINPLSLVLENAKIAGVISIITVGTNFESNVKILKIAEENQDFVFPSIGIHPWDVESEDRESLEFIEANVGKCVAIGEIGLDFWIKKDKSKQVAVFRHQLEIACRNHKPVLVHSRGAWEDCYKIIKEIEPSKVIFHWYSGPLHILDQILESGYSISATPAAEYSKHLGQAIRHAPLSSILLETDSPVKYRGKVSEPADVITSLKAVAELKRAPLEEVAKITTINAEEFFGL